jgi:CheY-like chemotaxis protein
LGFLREGYQAPMRILIVDDFRTVSECIKIAYGRSEWFLENASGKSFDITQVQTFEEASEIFQSDSQFDCILLDYNLNSDFIPNNGDKLMRILIQKFWKDSLCLVDVIEQIIPITSDEIGLKRINELREKLFRKV